MTYMTNASVTMSNSSMVFSSQNAYTSIELYCVGIALFLIFVMASLFLDGGTKPFEKLFAAISAFIFSVGNALHGILACYYDCRCYGIYATKCIGAYFRSKCICSNNNYAKCYDDSSDKLDNCNIMFC